MSEAPKSISPALVVDAPKAIVEHLSDARQELMVTWLALSTVRFMLDPSGLGQADAAVKEPFTVAQLASDIAARSRALAELARECRGLLGEVYPQGTDLVEPMNAATEVGYFQRG